MGKDSIFDVLGSPSASRRSVLRAAGASAFGATALGATGTATAQSSLPDADDVVHTWTDANWSTVAEEMTSQIDKRVIQSLSVSFFGTVPESSSGEEGYFEAEFKVDSYVQMIGKLGSEDWSEAELEGDIMTHQVTAAIEDGAGEFPYGPRSGISLKSHPQPSGTPVSDAFWEVGVGMLLTRADKVGDYIGAGLDVLTLAELTGRLYSDDGADVPQSNVLQFRRSYPSIQDVPIASATMFVRASIDVTETPAKVTFRGLSWPADEFSPHVELPVYVNEEGAALDPEQLDEPFSAIVQGPRHPPAGSTQTYSVTHDEREYDPVIDWTARYPDGSVEEIGSGQSVEFDVPRSTVRGVTVSVEVDPANASSVVASANVSPSGFAPDIQFEELTAPAGTIDRPYEVEVDWRNEGGSGDVTLSVDAYDAETDEHLGSYYSKTGQIEDDASGSDSIVFTPDATLEGEVELVVEAEPGERVAETTTFEAIEEPVLEFQSLVVEDGEIDEPTVASVQYENVGAAGETEIDVVAKERLTGDELEVLHSGTYEFSAGETGAREFEFTPSVDASGTVSVEVDAANGDQISEPATFEATGEPDFAFDLEPSDAYVGEISELPVQYENAGGSAQVEISLEVYRDGFGSHIETVATETLAVSAGESGSFTFEFVPTEEMEGEVTVSVEAPSDQGLQQRTVTVRPVRDPDFLFDLEPSEGYVGETYELPVQYENDGGPTEAEISLEVYRDGFGSHIETVASKTLDVVGGESGSFTFEFVPTEEMEGEVTVSVEAPSDQGLQQRTVTLHPERDPDFAFDLEPSDAYVSEPYELPVQYENSGGRAEVEISLEVYRDGFGSHIETVASRTLDVAGGESGSFTFEFVPTEEMEGEVTVSVEAPSDQGLQQRTVTVRPVRDPDFLFGLEPSEGYVGETYELPVQYENDGGPGEVAVSLEVYRNGFGSHIETVASRTLDVAGGESGSFTFEFVPTEEMEGEVTVSVEAPSDQGLQQRTVTINPENDTGIDCVEFEGGQACDVDGDGNYRDVTGDESVTNTDVTEFFANQHTPAWDGRPELFDFDGDDEVGQSDVVALFEYIVS